MQQKLNINKNNLIFDFNIFKLQKILKPEQLALYQHFLFKSFVIDNKFERDIRFSKPNIHKMVLEHNSDNFNYLRYKKYHKKIFIYKTLKWTVSGKTEQKKIIKKRKYYSIKRSINKVNKFFRQDLFNKIYKQDQKKQRIERILKYRSKLNENKIYNINKIKKIWLLKKKGLRLWKEKELSDIFFRISPYGDANLTEFNIGSNLDGIHLPRTKSWFHAFKFEYFKRTLHWKSLICNLKKTYILEKKKSNKLNNLKNLKRFIIKLEKVDNIFWRVMSKINHKIKVLDKIKKYWNLKKKFFEKKIEELKKKTYFKLNKKAKSDFILSINIKKELTNLTVNGRNINIRTVATSHRQYKAWKKNRIVNNDKYDKLFFFHIYLKKNNKKKLNFK